MYHIDLKAIHQVTNNFNASFVSHLFQKSKQKLSLNWMKLLVVVIKHLIFLTHKKYNSIKLNIIYYNNI